MLDLTTLHIPADMDIPIEVTSDLDVTDMLPLHVSNIDVANPDEFALAMYADYNSVNTADNHRASLIVEMTTKKGDEPAVLSGDIYIVLDNTLAKEILANDDNYQFTHQTMRSFMVWIDGYSKECGRSGGHILEAIDDFLTHAKEKQARDQTAEFEKFLGDVLGLNPEQVSVIHL